MVLATVSQGSRAIRHLRQIHAATLMKNYLNNNEKNILAATAALSVWSVVTRAGDFPTHSSDP